MLDRAVEVPFRSVEDLATVWCEYAEMEIRHGCVSFRIEFQEAVEILL